MLSLLYNATIYPGVFRNKKTGKVLMLTVHSRAGISAPIHSERNNAVSKYLLLVGL